MKRQMEFRDAQMSLSDGTTLSIPKGVLTVEEKYDPRYVAPLYSQSGQQLYYSHPEPQMEFTLAPTYTSNTPGTYTITHGHNLTLSKKDIEAIAQSIVNAMVNELEERDGLSIDDRTDRDDIINTLIELVTCELGDCN